MNRPTSPKMRHNPARSPRRSASAASPVGAIKAPTVKALVAATAVALMLLPEVRDAHAQVIGDIDVRSRLGEKFFAAVPVQSERVLDPNCIQVASHPSAPQGAQTLDATRVRINPTGAVESVIIETAGPVTSAVVALRLQVGCTNPAVRDFVVQGETAPAIAMDTRPQRPATVTPPRAAQRAPAQRRAAPRAAPAAQQTAAAAPPIAAITPPAAPAQPRGATVAPRAPQPAARGEDSTPKAPVITSHSLPLPGAAIPSTPSAPPSLADQEAQKRITDLRARSDDHAANLLALEDRLSLLQKQAELLKAQLEQTMASPAATSQPGSTPAPVSTAEPLATPAAASAPGVTPLAAQPTVKARSLGDVLTDWRVLGGALGGLLIAAAAYGFGRRKPVEPERSSPAATPAWQKPLARESSQGTGARFDRTQEMQAPQIPQSDHAADWRPTDRMADITEQWESRPPTTTTMPVAEGVPESAIVTQPGVGITRDFHITQQFQPTNERAVALSTPDEIVQQARTHYMDDGDTFRAIDLLEMAVSVRSDSTRPWQALFAIYRRENMTERYQRLAVAYRQAFGEDSNWAAIQGLGYQVDPSNPLYEAAASAPPVAEDLLERWLGVPLDFTAHLLANEMHDQLMETFPGRGKTRKRVSGE